MIGSLSECVFYMTKCGAEKQFECKEHKKRRSLTQNAYYWAMLNKLARALRTSDSDLHKQMLRDYGVCEVMSLSLSVPLEDYFSYFDVVGMDYAEGEERRIVRVYKGSSRMDSAEFTRLIEGMRYECELQGIDVMTPEEIARLRFVEPGKDNQ